MRILLTIILISYCCMGLAQEKAPGLPAVENLQDFYRTGIGVRVGWPIAALTFKHFIKKRTALEVIAAPHRGGGSITALFEFHRATRRDGLYWYYGVGADAGIFDGDDYRDYEGNLSGANSVTTVGVAAVLGIEKNIHETPFSIGADLKPRVGIYNGGGSLVEGAVSFKYIWGW